MIAIRRCHKCHRRYDGRVGETETLCPLCRGMKDIEWDDEAVYVPDTRSPCEGPFVKGEESRHAYGRERRRRQDEEKKEHIRILAGDRVRYMDYAPADEDEADDFLYAQDKTDISEALVAPPDWEPLTLPPLGGEKVPRGNRKSAKRPPKEPAPVKGNTRQKGRTKSRGNGTVTMTTAKRRDPYKQ